MDLNWIESILYGLFAGLADILPVSSQAHRMLLISLFGEGSEPVLLRLLVHISTLAALYYSCRSHITRITRARKLAQIPKRRRKRPLDTFALMDFSMLRNMLVPVAFGFLFYNRISSLVSILSVLAFTLFLNGIILFVPQYLPGSNKDSQSMTPLDSLLMGLGAVVSMLPGISCIGIVTSIGTIRGADKRFALNMALLLNIAMTVGLILFDIIAIVTGAGLGTLSFGVFFSYILSAAAAFGGTFLGIKIMRKMASTVGFGGFAYYCWGAALFSFILFLTI